MPTELFADTIGTASTTLSGNGGSITSGALTANVASAAGFSVTGGQMRAVIDPDTANAEVVIITGISGTTFTWTRGAEGTPLAHNDGAVIEARVTSGSLANMVQLSPSAAQSGGVNVTGGITAADLIVGGLTGATAGGRYPGFTASGPPTTGTWAIGDIVPDQVGRIWVCIVAGTPGSWIPVGSLDHGAANTARVSPYDRHQASQNSGLISGTVYYTYAKPSWPLTVSNLLLTTGGTAAATVTTIRGGIYTADASNNLTLVAATANLAASGANIVGGASNVAGMAAVNSVYHFPLTLAGDLTTSQTTYALSVDQWYAFALIVVATTMPNSASAAAAGVVWGSIFPRLNAARSAQTDLAASVTGGSQGTGNFAVYLAAE